MTTMETIKSYCASCDRDTKSEVVGKHGRVLPEPALAELEYRLVECLACGQVSLNIRIVNPGRAWDDPARFMPLIAYHDSGKDLTFPWKPMRSFPAFTGQVQKIDRILGVLLYETYTALNNGCYVLAASGLRTIFDRTTKVLQVDQELPFLRKLERLQELGHIGDQERSLLSVLVDAGSAAVHRGWQPSPKQLEPLFDVMEQFLKRALITADAVSSVRVPPRRGG